MLVAQISDSHVLRRGARLFGAIDAHRALERAVEAVLRLDPPPDVVIHTGDLANDGDDGDYAQIAAILARLPMPVLVVPGNHDIRDLVRAHFADTGAMPAEGPLHQRVEIGGLVLVGLDTLVEGQGGGRVGAAQLDWLDGALAEAPERPALVILHHPPFVTGIAFMDRIGLEDRDALGDVIARHPQVRLVAAGHVHRAIQTRLAAALAVTAPATAHQVVFDMRADAQERWIPEPPAFLVHRFAPRGGVVSHTVYIGEHGADAPFSGHHTFVADNAGQRPLSAT